MKLEKSPGSPSRWLQGLGCLAGFGLGLVVTMAEESADGPYEEPELSDRDRRFWAFRPPVGGNVPRIEDPRSRGPIDAFVVEAMTAQGMAGLAPAAPPETLLRRLAYQVTGLPPTEGELRHFLSAWEGDREGALEAAIDDWLSRPGYGERWAQHWLDVARYSDTDGFEHDKGRAEAWRYRDWVIDSLNRDLPYDRFVALQVAGDELEPENPGAWVATGFLTGGPDMPDINLETERRHNVLNELTGAIGAAFLGLTLECAQCHDHKSDPISQADFYRLRAVFDAFDLPKKNVSLPVIFPVDSKPGDPSHLYERGDFRRPGIEVAPGVPRILRAAGDSEKSEEPISRADLARWFSRPGHPLTARVMVNRTWGHHFGEPLVRSPSDFGKLGERPSHPALLDWLATRFVEEGWSLKWLHREILRSGAWRQASRIPEVSSGAERAEWEARLAADPENRWFSRQRRQRLDGEAIRDSLLAIAGRLNRKAGGPGVRPPLPPEVTSTLLSKQWPVTEDATEHDRRSVYLFARRNLRFPFFDAFDRPDPNQSCSRRYVSTTAPQALTLLNDEFVWEMAQEAAGDSSGESEEARVRSAYRSILGRNPEAAEIALAAEFLESQPASRFYLALFNLNEFVYLD